MREIRGNVKNYPWGKIGRDSKVFELVCGRNSQADVNAPYAELWMGTHKSGECELVSENEQMSFRKYLEKNTTTLGFSLDQENLLPYLLKVLSINKPLSIQVHPNKDEAAELNQTFPDIYKDPNHKPEMAIALTDFEALVGLRSYKAISFIMSHLTPLKSIMDHDLFMRLNYDCFADDQESEKLIKSLFARLFDLSTEEVGRIILKMHEFIKNYDFTQPINKPNDLSIEEVFQVFDQLTSHYPDDVGCILGLLLNYVKLRSGEAIFLKAKTVHAYLSGDCVECMACSDNVIRAGLTPKFKDSDSLIRLMNFGSETINSLKVNYEETNMPLASGENCVRVRTYDVGLEEFVVERIQCDKFKGFIKPRPVGGGSLTVVLEGKGTFRSEKRTIAFDKGTIIFTKANQEITIYSEEDDFRNLLLFRAYPNKTRAI